MMTNYLEKMMHIYNTMDSVLITNLEGVVEYSAIFDEKDHSIKNEGYTGKYLLDVYPELTRETSTHFRAMRTGKAVLDEVQTVTDLNGMKLTFVSNTYPIEVEGKIVGAIEGTVILAEGGKPYSKRIKEESSSVGHSLYQVEDMIGHSSRIQAVKEKILRAAEGDSTVLIVGETGTGKEIAAQAIHSHSSRRDQAFISQNCSAIPESLLESTLFGTVRGSYTGAEDRKGLLELADKGTLFLDELNSMNIELQGKILKAVEEQKIRRLGSEKERKIDVRIISAINEGVAQVLEKEKMRKDLYYRLGVFQIELPLLKERREDVPLLIQHFIQYYNKKGQRKIEECSQLAERLLMDYDWPGNVRELKNVIEYAFNMTRGRDITINNLPEHLVYDKRRKEQEASGLTGDLLGLDVALNQQGDEQGVDWETVLENGATLGALLDDYEKQILNQVLEGSASVTEAADKLGVSRQVLNYKIKKHGL
ncbi:transcriptional regulator [Aminipila butyrica]|uniref:Transcriptional regulator n=1 Tax=Aminipila butyrica TaxID=433296 RepID=A0A858BZH2_9FIRM|nr:sigma 54-interacting transcriptional regulator [Aminipila butyrica]QIB70545.1 transcriptional regulator [Aminipila butyrica]